MQSVRQVQRLNEVELEKCIPSNASWHTDYRDTAYIYIGGLPFELSEGDILTIFSQFGNPVHINLVRDKETGKSRGFCFLKYEDQRSCDLAVDNLSGAGVMGRVLSVDHTRYKRKEGEVETIGDSDDGGTETDQEGDGRKKRRRTSSQSSADEQASRPLLKEEVELNRLLTEHDDDDPMKAYLIEEKRAEVEEALKTVSQKKERHKDLKSRHRRREHRRSRRRDNDNVVSTKPTYEHGSYRKISSDDREIDAETQNRRRRRRRNRSESSGDTNYRSRQPRPERDADTQNDNQTRYLSDSFSPDRERRRSGT